MGVASGHICARTLVRIVTAECGSAMAVDSDGGTPREKLEWQVAKFGTEKSALLLGEV